jgi:hypothetical protein
MHHSFQHVLLQACLRTQCYAVQNRRPLSSIPEAKYAVMQLI